METELRLYPVVPPGSNRELRLLAEAASEYWDIPLDDLKSRTRTIDMVWPRNVCMFIARDADYTFNAIGSYWNRDHGTAIHAINMVKNLRETRPAYDKQFRQFALFAKNYIKKRKSP